jgi:hypothetical protein
MTNNKMPFVAIIGGFYHMQDPVEIADAQNTAKELGAALAKAGMGLVVYFSDANSLEPHVVEGYVKATPAGTGAGSIRVRFAESQKNTVKFPEQATNAEMFERVLFPGQEWEAPFYRSLVDAEGVDAVLLMAGGRSTLIAGQIALARRLPMLSVDKFNGTACSIRTELARETTGYPSASTHTITQMVEWLQKKCESWIEQQAQERNERDNYRMMISQKTKSIWAGLSFVVLLTLVILGVAQVLSPGMFTVLMVGALVMAGATGAILRSVRWGAEETPIGTSLILGAAAGFTVGLAYLIPQLIGAPGVFEPSSTAVTATDKIQFLSAILVAISAGVGFDTVFTRLKKQAETQTISVPGQ